MGIIGSKPWTPKGIRKGELSVMDILIDKMSVSKLKEVNSVRLYLEVTFPSSEVLSLSGQTIMDIKEGVKVKPCIVPDVQFPNQRKPKCEWIKMWEKALEIIEEEYKEINQPWLG